MQLNMKNKIFCIGEKRWDCMAVVCVEPIEGLRAGSTYKVKGQGNLKYNAATDKEGWGLCIEDEWVGVFDDEGNVIENSWKLSDKERTRFVYMTLEELERHFITDEEDFVRYKRDERLKSIGI